MNFPYLSPSHITLTEDTVEVSNDTGAVEQHATNWEATYSGKSAKVIYGMIEDVGPHVEMTRTGANAREAEDNLLQALFKEGWVMR